MEGLLSNQIKLAMPQLFLRGVTRISMSAPPMPCPFQISSGLSHLTFSATATFILEGNNGLF